MAPLALSLEGGIEARFFHGNGSAVTDVNAVTLRGRETSSFANTSHAHSGSDIQTGTVAEARIDSRMARDTEVAASYVPKTGGTVTGDLAIGTSSPQAPLHVSSANINIRDNYLNGEDVLIEGHGATVGIYSSTDGSDGSALVFGETPAGSAEFHDKWAIVRETSGGGQDLRFTFGADADYFKNETRFEIGDDGILTGAGIARAFAVVSDSGVVLQSSPNVEGVVRVSAAGSYSYILQLKQPILRCNVDDIPFTPVAVAAATTAAFRSAQYECGPACEAGAACGDLYIQMRDSVGNAPAAPFSVVVW